MANPYLVNEALKIIEYLNKKGVTIRVVGAASVYLHLTNETRKLWEIMGRRMTDMDFAAYSTHRQEIEKALECELGYKVWRPALTPTLTQNRIIFYKTSGNQNLRLHEMDTKGDVFLDELCMNHTIKWIGRLEVDYPTIPLAELFLEKTQIVGGPQRLGMGEKDAIDLLCLLLDHEVGSNDKDTINAEFIADRLSKDWGFYYTVSCNIKKLVDFWLPKYKLSEQNREVILTRINKLKDSIESKPKSLQWKMRSKIGTKSKWYQDVEEVERCLGT